MKDYRVAAATYAEKFYKKVCSVGCRHHYTSSWDDMVKNRRVSCSSGVSVIYRAQGILPAGKSITHSPNASGQAGYYSKSAILSAAGQNVKKAAYMITKGTYTNVQNCRVYWVGGKYFRDLPYFMRRAGCTYVQWSNVCMCAGPGKVYSTNGNYLTKKNGDSVARYWTYYKEHKGVLCDSGYGYGTTSPIYVVYVPYDKRVEHYAVEVWLGFHGLMAQRIKDFGTVDAAKIQKMVNRMGKDPDLFCRWAADYILEGYGYENVGSGETRKKALGVLYDKTKYYVNYFVAEALRVWEGKVKDRQTRYGDLLALVQRQINRTASGFGGTQIR